MGCTGSRANTRDKRSSSNVSDVSDAPHDTGHQRTNAPPLGSTTEAKGDYLFSAGLPADADFDGDDSAIVHRGPVQLENGLTYTGQFKGRKKHGKGTQLWPDGARFDGEWVDDKACGFGVFKHADGDLYEGQWANDKANGFGKLTHKDGSTYEGMFKDDSYHGAGKETWIDGSRFEGNYNMGKREGRGRFTWPNSAKPDTEAPTGDAAAAKGGPGECQYDGEFSNNEIGGWGRYAWPYGRVYCGQWVDNKMQGFGVFIWPNGQIYRGQYEQDKKEGWGEFLWPDKKIYSGWWKAGKQHGFGKFRSPKGETRLGIWEHRTRLDWLTPEQAEEYKRSNNVPPEPELPEMPSWLEELCQASYPEWYKQAHGISTSPSFSAPDAAPADAAAEITSPKGDASGEGLSASSPAAAISGNGSPVASN